MLLSRGAGIEVLRVQSAKPGASSWIRGGRLGSTVEGLGISWRGGRSHRGVWAGGEPAEYGEGVGVNSSRAGERDLRGGQEDVPICGGEVGRRAKEGKGSRDRRLIFIEIVV